MPEVTPDQECFHVAGIPLEGEDGKFAGERLKRDLLIAAARELIAADKAVAMANGRLMRAKEAFKAWSDAKRSHSFVVDGRRISTNDKGDFSGIEPCTLLSDAT